jgi:hypothetical protein
LRRRRDGRGRKLEHHHVNADGRAQRDAQLEKLGWRTDGNAGRHPSFSSGTVAGDDVAWKISITNPMPLTLAFTGKVSGDSMSGEMGIGPMGSFPFRGTRA